MATPIGTELISEIPPTFPKSDQIIQPPRVKSSGPKKKLLRRTGHDYSQALRRGYQLGFLLINLWLGGVFYAWVRQFEAGAPRALSRPAGVEGWLPIAGMMKFKSWAGTGPVPAMHPAATFLLITFGSLA